MNWFTRAMASLLLAASSASAVAADFAGAGTGPIPDSSPTGITVSFNVSGNVSGVGDLALNLGLTHTWSGDLDIVLRSPGGVATLVVVGRLGRGEGSSAGESADFGGMYRFSDRASQDLWLVSAPLANSDVIPSGVYRTSTRGMSGTYRGGCTTWLVGAFGGLSGAQVNGTWTLTVADLGAGDVGTIDSALLSIGEASDKLFADGFDAPLTGDCVRVRSDYTGSGRSSFVVLRNTGGGPTGAATWFVKDNDGGTTGSASSFVLGDASDYFVDGDFDGDGIADAAACDLTTGACSIRRSSRPGTPWVVPFGQAGDNVTHVGDYDGDGIDDLAAYRAGASTGQVSHTVVRLTRSGAVRDLVTGEHGAFAHGGIDYTGDSMADMAIQSDAGGGVAAFRIYDGTTGAMVSTFTFGTPSDIMVLGNHGGSEWGDITVTPSVSGNLNWTTRDGQTGVGQPSVMHGVTGDYRLSGDFDGDGQDDYAVWRPSTTAGQSKFVVRRSSAPSPLLEVNFGQLDDYPIETSRVH